MSSTKSRISAVLVAALLVAGATGGAMAALTTDTGTTTSTAVSDLTANDVVTEPNNASKANNVRVVGDTNTNTSTINPETAMKIRYVVTDANSEQQGDVLYEDTSNWTVTAVSGAPDEYNKSITNTKWGDDLQYGATQNVSMDARIVFNETKADESWNNISHFTDPAGDDARIEASGDEVSTADASRLSLSSVPFVGSDNATGAAQAEDTIAVTSNTSTITVDTDNSTAVDAFDKVSEASAGSFATNGWVIVNGQVVPVFSGTEADVDANWLDTDEAYATVSDGGAVVVHNANSTFESGTTSIDVSATGNEALGAFQTLSLLRDYGAGFGTIASNMVGAADVNGTPNSFTVPS